LTGSLGRPRPLTSRGDWSQVRCTAHTSEILAARGGRSRLCSIALILAVPDGRSHGHATNINVGAGSRRGCPVDCCGCACPIRHRGDAHSESRCARSSQLEADPAGRTGRCGHQVARRVGVAHRSDAAGRGYVAARVGDGGYLDHDAGFVRARRQRHRRGGKARDRDPRIQRDDRPEWFRPARAAERPVGHHHPVRCGQRLDYERRHSRLAGAGNRR